MTMNRAETVVAEAAKTKYLIKNPDGTFVTATYSDSWGTFRTLLVFSEEEKADWFIRHRKRLLEKPPEAEPKPQKTDSNEIRDLMEGQGIQFFTLDCDGATLTGETQRTPKLG